MKWLAGLLDRFLDWIAPLPDFSGPDWLTDEEADLDAWEPFEFPSDTTREGEPPLHVTGMVPGSPDLAPAGTDSQIDGAVGSGGFTDDEIIAGLRSYLRKFYRG